MSPKPAKKRKLSAKELRQRRAAAKKAHKAATGPRTPEGKLASSRNRITHGRYAKSVMNSAAFRACKSTCSQFNACEHIRLGDTRPGQRCLDRKSMIMAYDAILLAMKTQDFTQMHEIGAGELAGQLDLIRALRDSISDRGAVLDRPLIGSDGKVLVDPEGKQLGDVVLHPAVLALPKLMDQIGLSLPQFLATPLAHSKIEQHEEEMETAATVFGRIASKFRQVDDASALAVDAEIVDSTDAK